MGHPEEVGLQQINHRSGWRAECSCNRKGRGNGVNL